MIPHRPLLRAALAAALAAPLAAQQAPPDGPRQVRPGWHALVGGTVVVAPGNTIPEGTVVLRDGRITAAGAGVEAPDGARVWDCSGLTVYAGLIEPYLPVGVPEADPDIEGNHWNAAVAPQRRAVDGAGIPGDARRDLVEAGFAAAAIAPEDGVLRGRAGVVLLGDRDRDPEPPAVREEAYHTLAFDRRTGGYPGSEMGVIAVMRQALLDAEWHETCLATRRLAPDRHPPVPPRWAAEALADRSLPLWFATRNENQALRAAAIAGERQRQAVIVGSGLEFRRLDALAATGLPVVLPVDFPGAPDVSALAKAERVSLRDLMTWEQAPTNPHRVLAAGITAALTTHGLDDRSDFADRVREALANGLTRDQALAMVTTTPARLLGIDGNLGTIEPGRIANLTVVDGELFGEDAAVRSVWIRGHRHEVEPPPPPVEGDWSMVVHLQTESRAGLRVAAGKVVVERDDEKAEGERVAIRGRHLEFVLDGAVFGIEGRFTLAAHVEGGNLFGSGTAPDGSFLRWMAVPAEAETETEETAAGDERSAPEPVAGEVPAHERTLPLPLGAYGFEELPGAQELVFTGATIWTSGPAGTIANGALWIRDGEVVWVGDAADLPDVGDTPLVDLAGKHVAPGIIDCHSHTGIRGGVNESRQTTTGEVRIRDVVDPDDIGWYRELAGGVTAVNQLHGSANAIGGQNHVVKLRWGVAHPDDMALEGAPAGIKFALGENPRRANWSRGSDRYPGSRMGVAAIIRDRFVAARDDTEAWQRYRALPPEERARTMPPRRDLELEAIAEILRGDRLIHCHSYRQDEILMLCRLADEFGFVLGTLQHVLEGYKVAEAIERSALGASAFSDWWAYKLEVFDAIPENGAIMHEVGVTVSFNSDSDELARRLNVEAGKAVKYGDVPPDEALKFVTLNPAIQLGIADRVGSLEKGKDADFAVWSGNPLSTMSRCEATWIDGRPYFSAERDRVLREQAAGERRRLIQKALVAKRRAQERRVRYGRYFTAVERYSCCTAQQEEQR